MKKYEIPAIEVLSFAIEDVITTSTGNGSWQEGAAGPDD